MTPNATAFFATAALALAFTLSTLAPVESVSCADPEWSETCVGVSGR